MARCGLREQALDQLRLSGDGGVLCPEFMARDPWFDSLSGDAEFERILERAHKLQREAQEGFSGCKGERILGL